MHREKFLENRRRCNKAARSHCSENGFHSAVVCRTLMQCREKRCSRDVLHQPPLPHLLHLPHLLLAWLQTPKSRHFGLHTHPITPPFSPQSNNFHCFPSSHASSRMSADIYFHNFAFLFLSCVFMTNPKQIWKHSSRRTIVSDYYSASTNFLPSRSAAMQRPAMGWNYLNFQSLQRWQDCSDMFCH